jgi:hypothetical protein
VADEFPRRPKVRTSAMKGLDVRGDLIRICSVVALAGVCLLLTAAGAAGHAPTATILYGGGTASVDGSLASGEWSSARRLDFGARVPDRDGGGTVTATIRAMNDGATLYVSFEVGRATYGGLTGLALYFDNDHDGVREEGDDAFFADVGTFSPVRFVDWHWAPCTPGGPGVACPVFDTGRGGTSEGTSAAGLTPGTAVIEVSHPLNSSDDSHDFSLGPGDVAGFAAFVRLFSADTSCNSGPACYADTFIPIGIPDHGQTAGYGHLVVAPDLIPPETAIEGVPAEGATTKLDRVSFELRGTDNLTPGDQLRFSCSLDGPAVPCGPPATFSGLADGRHRLEARAADEVGNVDSTPAVRNWTVDTTPPPRPRIRVRVRGAIAIVRLSAVDAASGPIRFRCSLDNRSYRICSPLFTVRLKPGPHVLRAVASDRLGNRSTPGVAHFRVGARP